MSYFNNKYLRHCVVVILSTFFVSGCKVSNISENNIKSTVCKRYTDKIKVFVQKESNSYDSFITNTFYLDSSKLLQSIEYNGFDSVGLDKYVNALVNCKEQKIRNTIFCVLYYDTIYSQSDTLYSNNLKAISIYSLKNNYYEYNLFVKSDGYYIRNDDLSGVTYKTTTFPFLSIGANVILRKKSKFSYVVLGRAVYNNTPEIIGLDLLEERLKRYTKKNKLGNNFPPK